MLLPRGPVVMWSRVGAPHGRGATPSHTPPPGSLSSLVAGRQTTNRADWAAGRDMSAEEARCGMLTTVGASQLVATTAPSPSSSAAAGQRRAVAAPTDAVVPQRRRKLNAVIKADVGDWQMNELDDGAGEAVTLTRRPKGRWIKLTKDETEKVEVDTREEFGIPHKRFQERIVNYGYYKQIAGPIPADRPVLQLSLYRENTALSSVLARAARRCRVPTDTIDYSSPKESFGCVTQLVSAIGARKEILQHANRMYNLNAIVFNPLFHGGPEAIVRGCSGNAWRVLLRCVDGGDDDVAAALEHLQSSGFVNYVPLNTFGATSNFAHETFGAAARGDYLDACRFWLQSEAERNPVLHEGYLRYVNAERSSLVGVIDGMLRDCHNFRMTRRLGPLLQRLRAATADGSVEAQAQELWEAIPLEDREAGISAAPAFAWNAAASQRLLSYGTRVVAGDLVAPSDGSGVRVVRAGEEGQFEIEDVVLPLAAPAAGRGDLPSTILMPQTPKVNARFYEALNDAHGLAAAAAQWRDRALLAPASTSLYRPLIVKPASLRWKAIEDPDSLTILKTDRFLREEGKPVGVGITSDEDGQGRIRQPTPLQVPVALRDAMQPAIHDPRSGTTSVALSFQLPPGSHPTAMLREGFNLRHLHFHDLLSPVAVDTLHLPQAADDAAPRG